MADPTNEDRADWAHLAVAAYGEAVLHLGLGDAAPDELATDLLCDLRHWCDRWGVDFADALHRSHTHYWAELYGDGLHRSQPPAAPSPTPWPPS